MKFIAINYARIFATTLNDNVNEIRRKKFIVAIVCCLLLMIYDLWKHSLCEFDWKWSISLIVVFFRTSFCKIAFIETIRKFDYWRYDCILFDFLLNLSHVNFLSFWFCIVLQSNNFAFVSFLNRLKSFDNILLCFCWNRRSINYWRNCSYFDFWWFAKRTKRSKSLFFNVEI